MGIALGLCVLAVLLGWAYRNTLAIILGLVGVIATFAVAMVGI